MDLYKTAPPNTPPRRDGELNHQVSHQANVPLQSAEASCMGERATWRLFESNRRSAILHAEQYLQHSPGDTVKQSPTSTVYTSSLAVQSDDQSQADFWNRKVAKENLLRDLEALRSLLRDMSSVSKSGLSTCYTFNICLTIAAALANSNSNPGSSKRWSTLAATFGFTAFTAYRTFRYGVLCMCSGVVDSLLNALTQGSFDTSDVESLKGRCFEMLWWIYHLTARDAETS
ncbi:hypothetical protein GQ44DRAFT_779269 [Phaeosphaeriaceae sp. PMI808]|nr:hypothetical protein GQ44DRAFT_779269 [Phaeosphaeriaceae sp. PMI808]